MIVLIDNYDSFTYNIVQYVGSLGHDVNVIRNDAMTVRDVLEMNPQAIIISPGPGTPQDSGICLDLIKENAAQSKPIPLLGVCLGHQALGEAFGGDVIRASKPMHGKTSQITHEDSSVFKGLPSPLRVTRYHSLIIDRSTCPECLMITAQTDDNIIMGVQHKTLPFHGIQFHPESIETQDGLSMIETFLKGCA